MRFLLWSIQESTSRPGHVGVFAGSKAGSPTVVAGQDWGVGCGCPLVWGLLCASPNSKRYPVFLPWPCGERSSLTNSLRAHTYRCVCLCLHIILYYTILSIIQTPVNLEAQSLGFARRPGSSEPNVRPGTDPYKVMDILCQ